MISERIRMIRKKLNLTQAEFGNRIGLKSNTITSYETGARVPSDAALISICREYGASYNWLISGEGSMFPPLSHNEQISGFAADVINCDDNVFKKRLITALSQLTSEQWDILETIVDKLNEQEY